MKPGSDETWMKLALALARRGEGLTRPNPPVGAVVVRNRALAGQGYHSRAGGDHAETIAIGEAGRLAKGATLYATLEPCCTVGKTPPCTDLIIRSGIRRLVVAARDPKPLHRGRGLILLRNCGIEVTEGICGEEGRRLITPFAKRTITGRPYVILKLGMSLDGKIADRRGISRWISGRASREMVQEMRRRSDAIVVGAGTVLADNPSLLPRPAKGRQPFRVLLDAKGLVEPSALVLSDGARHRTIVATTRSCPAARRAAWLKTGASVWSLRETVCGVSMSVLLDRLGREGMLQVLCEGGADIAEALIRARLVDEYVFFVAPRIIGGGTRAKSAVGGCGWRLEKAPKLVFIGCRRVENDIMLRAVPPDAESWFRTGEPRPGKARGDAENGVPGFRGMLRRWPGEPP